MQGPLVNGLTSGVSFPLLQDIVLSQGTEAGGKQGGCVENCVL